MDGAWNDGLGVATGESGGKSIANGKFKYGCTIYI